MRIKDIVEKLKTYPQDAEVENYAVPNEDKALPLTYGWYLPGNFAKEMFEDLDAMFASPHYFPNRFKADLELDYKDFRDKYDYDPYVYSVSREDDSRQNRLSFLHYLVEDKKLVR